MRMHIILCVYSTSYDQNYCEKLWNHNLEKQIQCIKRYKCTVMGWHKWIVMLIHKPNEANKSNSK